MSKSLVWGVFFVGWTDPHVIVKSWTISNIPSCTVDQTAIKRNLFLYFNDNNSFLLSKANLIILIANLVDFDSNILSLFRTTKRVVMFCDMETICSRISFTLDLIDWETWSRCFKFCLIYHFCLYITTMKG